MRTLLLALLCVAAHSSLLRTNQQQISIVGTVQLLTRLFAQSFQGLTESLELELLSQLYPNNTLEVQVQLDACESSILDKTEDQLGALDQDIRAFRLACEDEDPSAPILKLMQDSMQGLANLAAPCDSLSVDIVGDIEKWIASGVVNGATFASEWTGPLMQWNAEAISSAFSSLNPYLQAVEDLEASVAVSMGLNNASVALLRSDISQEVNDWSNLLSVLSSGSLPTQANLLSTLNDAQVISKDLKAELEETMQRGMRTYGDAANAMCTFVTALLQA